jgi:hypothetical protein
MDQLYFIKGDFDDVQSHFNAAEERFMINNTNCYEEYLKEIKDSEKDSSFFLKWDYQYHDPLTGKAITIKGHTIASIYGKRGFERFLKNVFLPREWPIQSPRRFIGFAGFRGEVACG